MDSLLLEIINLRTKCLKFQLLLSLQCRQLWLSDFLSRRSSGFFQVSFLACLSLHSYWQFSASCSRHREFPNEVRFKNTLFRSYLDCLIIITVQHLFQSVQYVEFQNAIHLKRFTSSDNVSYGLGGFFLGFELSICFNYVDHFNQKFRFKDLINLGLCAGTNV